MIWSDRLPGSLTHASSVAFSASDTEHLISLHVRLDPEITMNLSDAQKDYDGHGSEAPQDLHPRRVTSLDPAATVLAVHSERPSGRPEQSDGTG